VQLKYRRLDAQSRPSRHQQVPIASIDGEASQMGYVSRQVRRAHPVQHAAPRTGNTRKATKTMLKLIGSYALAKLLGFGIFGAIVIYLLLSMLT
jgi:hypothetical protein